MYIGLQNFSYAHLCVALDLIFKYLTNFFEILPSLLKMLSGVYQIFSARRFATLIDLINRIGPCNRMIDYKKQKSIIFECTEDSASFAEVQL